MKDEILCPRATYTLLAVNISNWMVFSYLDAGAASLDKVLMPVLFVASSYWALILIHKTLLEGWWKFDEDACVSAVADRRSAAHWLTGDRLGLGRLSVFRWADWLLSLSIDLISYFKRALKKTNIANFHANYVCEAVKCWWIEAIRILIVSPWNRKKA